MKTIPKLTEAQIKALKIIRNHGPIKPRRFAKLMWADSDCWSHRTRCGTKGVTRGGGMSLAAGGYLGKLARKDLIIRKWGQDHILNDYTKKGYVLTQLGRALLKEAEDENNT